MQRKLTLQEIIDYYVEIGPIVEKATLMGDYKTTNKYTKPCIKIFKQLEQDIELARQVLVRLLSEKNIEVLTTAASYCLALNIFVEEAVKTLESIRDDPTTKILGFNAGMVLKVWCEKSLNIYKKKDKK